MHTRRAFLRTGTLGAAAVATVPTFLGNTFAQLHRQADGALTQTPTGKDDTILIVIQLAGGNDGLNTIIPHGHDEYYRARPRLGLPRDQILVIDQELGVHPSLEHLRACIGTGAATVVHGVGYPNPNRSHFRSSEIWHSADASDTRSATGWIGRYFDNACQGADPTVGISVDGESPDAFLSTQVAGISLSDPAQFRWLSEDRLGARSRELFRRFNRPVDLPPEPTGDPAREPGPAELSNLAFIERTALDTQVAVQKVQALQRAPQRGGFPGHAFGRQLELISRMIGQGFTTRVYYASHGGFDTHNQQLNGHARQLRQYDEAMQALHTDLAAQGNAERVVILTFSEFGRRVEENASAGTDHGAAAPLFLHGPTLTGGFLGDHPSLAELVNGDIQFSTDFRSVYASLLRDWLKTDPAPILGAQFPLLPLFAAAGSPNPAPAPASPGPAAAGSSPRPVPDSASSS